MQAHYLQFFSIEQKFEITSQRGLLGSKANVKGKRGKRGKTGILSPGRTGWTLWWLKRPRKKHQDYLGFEINPCILCVLLIFE